MGLRRRLKGKGQQGRVFGPQTSGAQMLHTLFEAELFPPPSPQRASFATGLVLVVCGDYQCQSTGYIGAERKAPSCSKVPCTTEVMGPHPKQASQGTSGKYCTRGQHLLPAVPRVIKKSRGHLESSILRTQITYRLVA